MLAVRNRHAAPCHPYAVTDRVDRTPQPYRATPTAEAYAAAGHARFPLQNDRSAAAVASISTDASGEVTVSSLGDDGTKLTLQRSRATFRVVYPVIEAGMDRKPAGGGMIERELAVAGAPECWAHPLGLALHAASMENRPPTSEVEVAGQALGIGETVEVSLPQWRAERLPMSLNQLEAYVDRMPGDDQATPSCLWSRELRATIFFGESAGETTVQEWEPAGHTFISKGGGFFEQYPRVVCGECASPTVYRPRHLDSRAAANGQGPTSLRDRALNLAISIAAEHAAPSGETDDLSTTSSPLFPIDDIEVSPDIEQHLRDIRRCLANATRA